MRLIHNAYFLSLQLQQSFGAMSGIWDLHHTHPVEPRSYDLHTDGGAEHDHRCAVLGVAGFYYGDHYFLQRTGWLEGGRGGRRDTEPQHDGDARRDHHLLQHHRRRGG